MSIFTIHHTWCRWDHTHSCFWMSLRLYWCRINVWSGLTLTALDSFTVNIVSFVKQAWHKISSVSLVAHLTTFTLYGLWVITCDVLTIFIGQVGSTNALNSLLSKNFLVLWLISCLLLTFELNVRHFWLWFDLPGVTLARCGTTHMLGKPLEDNHLLLSIFLSSTLAYYFHLFSSTFVGATVWIWDVMFLVGD